MHRLLRYRPTPAMLVALLAVVLATTGTSFAADAVNSVVKKIKGSQIAGNAITSAKVKNGSLLLQDFKASERSKLKGDPGAAGAAGAAGAKGDKGDKGDPGPLLDSLPSGKTLRGYYDAGGDAPGANDIAYDSITFQFPLSAAPETHFIKNGDPTPAGCSGDKNNPGADPGHLCVFEVRNAKTTTRAIQTGNSPNGAFKWGAGVYVYSNAAGQFESSGVWAVTAP